MFTVYLQHVMNIFPPHCLLNLLLWPLQVRGPQFGPCVLQQCAGGRGFGSEHADEVQVELSRVEVLQVGAGALGSGLVLPVPGGDPVLAPDVPQGVVIRTDVVRAAEHLPDDGALLGQRHEAVPEGHHPNHRGVHVLNVQKVP